MRRLLAVVAAVVLLAGCNYSLGRKDLGVRYAFSYSACSFTYAMWQDGWSGVFEIADMDSQPGGIYVCEVTMQTVTENNGTIGSPAPLVFSFGGNYNGPQCGPCVPQRSTFPGNQFGFRFTIRAWHPSDPGRIVFAHTWGGSRLG